MDTKLDIELLQHTQVSGFAYELLRGEVLFNLLGKEIDAILYWEGKNIARRYPLESLNDIIIFFERAGWGSLEIGSEKKSEIAFTLTSDFITYRSHEKNNACYQLEAGFLAQQIQQQKNFITEAYGQQKPTKPYKVTFTVKWDAKDLVEQEVV